MNIEQFYNEKYKWFFIIPLALLALSFIILFSFYAKNGDIIEKDISLEGGVSATIYIDKEINIEDVKNFLIEKTGKDVFVRSLAPIKARQFGILIESKDIDSKTLEASMEELLSIDLNDDNFFIEETGSRLGHDFYKQMVKSLIIAFVLMSIIIFISFRSFVPSFAVVLSAFFDIVITLAVVDVIGMEISPAGIAAFMLLIGYSVDTDILLTTRLLKRKGEDTIWNRLVGSFKTGLTMTVTTMVAMIVGIIFAKSPVLREMFIIILIGLFVDVFSTYTMNAGLLRWHIKRKYNE